MYKIFYTPESEDNLADIFEFIWEDNLFYATKVLTSIKSTIDILKLFPLSWKGIDNNKRMVVDSSYWYTIIYNFESWNIYILSIYKYKNNWF